MIRQKIAIVGTGISGLAAAWFLCREHDVTLFEQSDWIGGHSNTVTVKEDQTQVPIDTGFMVYNEVTYPLLTRLFRELGVLSKPTLMSFSVQHVGKNLEFNGGSLNLLFGQRKNLISPRFWKMLLQINRFNRETVEELKNPQHGDLNLEDYVKARGYGSDFFEWYLTPMAAAVWSSPPDCIKQFPAKTLLRFWHNHGFLGLHTQHPWLTVSGGSRQYVKRLIKPFETNIHQESPVKYVTRTSSGANLQFYDGSVQRFDKVVIAAHGDQARSLLADPTELELQLLHPFYYKENEVVLHTDPRFMPKTRRCWASWNYRMDRLANGDIQHSTHYWMNNLQDISDKENYFVSLNPPVLPDEDRVKRRLRYEHPLFDLKAIAAQQRLHELHTEGEETHRYFCGAWQRNGFHEDGLWSAVRMCTEILKRDPWS